MKYTIKNEVAKELAEKIGLAKTDKNSLQLQFGLLDQKEYIGNKATIVNGGIMEEISFASSRPNGETLTKETVVVSASTFISYVSALIGYNSDITLDVRDKVMGLSVGKQAESLIPLKREEDMDVLLPQNLNTCIVQIIAKPTELLNMLHVGAAFAEPGIDEQGLRDRVAIRITADGQLFAYSTDSTSVAKSWNSALVKFNDGGRAVVYLKNKGASLDNESKSTLLEKMNAAKAKGSEEGIKELIDLAVAEGMSNDYSFSIPAGSIKTLLALLKGKEESAYIMVCPDYLYLKADNIMATFTLSSGVPSVYSNTIDRWDTIKSTLKITFDKENMLRALSIMKLGDEKTPLSFTSKKGTLVLSKNKDKVNIPFVASDGAVDNLKYYYATDKLIAAISRLDNGNVTFKMGPCMAPCFYNGSIDEKNVKAYLYVYGVHVKEEPEEDKDDAEEED